MSATFAELGLSPRLLHAAEALGYERPTPIQVAAIPPALAGRDLLASAETGTGKTAAFAFPVMQQVEATTHRAPRGAHALVLVPTRELAVQVGEAMRRIAPSLRVPTKVAILHGGVSINPQLMAMRGGADVVVATPGRLLDVVEHNALDLPTVRCLVLDEADRLLDGGFGDELARVLERLRPQRQNLLFSATFPAAVQALARQLLRDPVQIEIAQQQPTAQHITTATEGTATAATAGDADDDAATARREERAIEVDAAKRTPLLRHLIDQGAWERVLVFVATRYACDHVADKLRRAGIAAEAFHGDASQGARTRALMAFKSGQLKVLVATDLGARGIDIAQLPVVVNYDLPRSAVDYVHRIGRTARAGAAGLAVSFVSADTEAHFRLIEKRQGRRVARERIAGFEPTQTATAEAGVGGVKGKRPSKKDKLRAAGG